jgi:REP element-mobilizing transposase RayT
MGFKYSIRSDHLHFLTHTVIDWIDLFTRKELAEIIVQSLNYCIETKGLEVYVWCLMPSHLHMIAGTAENNRDNLSDVMRDFKKFTSKAVIKMISEINESRKNWLLKHFQTGNDSFQVWQPGMHPIELFSHKFIDQKMDYIHNNPVEAGLVYEPQQYVLSSAVDYYESRKGLVNICYLG